MLLVSLLAGLTYSSGCSVPTPGASAGPTAPPGVETETPPVEAAISETATSTAPGAEPALVFAVIGDYGSGDGAERAVANLVKSHRPKFVITTGDNYYLEAGGVGTGRYDESAGAYYGDWMSNIHSPGSRYPVATAAVNGFFPSLGNHDYADAKDLEEDYLTYFSLPGAGFANTSGNERYYDFVQGPIHFFALNSNEEEPDGTSSDSRQGRWLQQQLAASTSPWNIVYFHHAPYTSGTFHEPTRRMQWPFAEWGADAVISGHAHQYERIMRDNIVYFVNGLGGGEIHDFGVPMPGSAVHYNLGWGAQIVTVTDTALDFGFYDQSGWLVDTHRLSAAPASGN
jgi:hypothetical protein